jgi:hypothetical protein
MFIKRGFRLQHMREGMFFIVNLQFNIIQLKAQVVIAPFFQTPTTT